MKKLAVFIISILFINVLFCYAAQEAKTIIGDKKHYNVINDKVFEGYAYYNEHDKEVVFWAMNKGRWFYDLKDSSYGVVIDRNGRTESYGLIFKKTTNLSYEPDSLIVNPYFSDALGESGGILIYCYPPFGILPSSDVKGYFITLKSGRKIRFGYEVLTWEQKVIRFLKRMWTGIVGRVKKGQVA